MSLKKVGQQPRILAYQLDGQGTHGFLEDDKDRTSRWVPGADETANHKREKTKGQRSARTGGSAWVGLVPARKEDSCCGGKTILLTGAL
jgi:hypothetical protein